MALLALYITHEFQLLPTTNDYLIISEFLPSSNKRLKTHDKNFQGSHARGTASESCLINHEADTSIFHKHHKRLEQSPISTGVYPYVSRWPVTLTAMVVPRSTSPSGAHTPSGHDALGLSPCTGRSAGSLPIPSRHSVTPSARTCSCPTYGL